MKRKVHIQFHSKTSITITNAYHQKNFDLEELGYGKYIDLIVPKNLGDSPPDSTRFMARYIGDGQLEVWYKAKEDQQWIRVGDAATGNFHYNYQNEANNRTEDTTDGTYEAQILD